jgi:hypothetical protein
MQMCDKLIATPKITFKNKNKIEDKLIATPKNIGKVLVRLRKEPVNP